MNITITVYPSIGNAYDVTFSTDSNVGIDKQIEEFIDDNLKNIEYYKIHH